MAAAAVLVAGAGFWAWSRQRATAAAGGSIVPAGWPYGASPAGTLPYSVHAQQSRPTGPLPGNAPPSPAPPAYQPTAAINAPPDWAVPVQIGTGAALSIAGTAAVGTLTTASVAIPVVGAAAALLTWGIVQKGWFRGGEEALHVNPARDQFVSAFKPLDQVRWGIPGGHGLAALLTGVTGQEAGGRWQLALNRADTRVEFEDAARAIIEKLHEDPSKTAAVVDGLLATAPRGLWS
jgi:hypothetical protein